MELDYTLSDDELKKLKEDFNKGIRDIDEELSRRRMFKNPYRYFVVSYGRSPNSGVKTFKTSNKKILEYHGKSRIGGNLIYFGYNHRLFEDGRKEIHSLFIKPRANRGDDDIGLMCKVLSDRYDIREDACYEELIPLAMRNILDKKGFDSGMCLKLLADCERFGNVLDNTEEDKKEILGKRLEFDYYSIRGNEDSIIFERKEE